MLAHARLVEVDDRDRLSRHGRSGLQDLEGVERAKPQRLDRGRVPDPEGDEHRHQPCRERPAEAEAGRDPAQATDLLTEWAEVVEATAP